MTTHIRTFAKKPSFSLLVIAVLALGIGIATAFYSVVDAVLLQPLAYRDSGQIVAIHTAWPAKSRVSRRVTGGDFLTLRSALHSFSALSFYNGGEMGVQLHNHSTLLAPSKPTPPSFTFSTFRRSPAACLLSPMPHTRLSSPPALPAKIGAIQRVPSGRRSTSTTKCSRSSEW